MKKNKEDAGGWSRLPTLIMWMIKDCLTSFLEHVRLASVCKDWKAACESYPFESRRQYVSPWLMQHECLNFARRNCAIREFMNVSTNEKFILNVPELVKADILYSKQGWLLLREKYMIGREETTITLLNLHSREKISMPELDKCLRVYLASFSSSANGFPECVVIDVFNASSLIFYTALVGDEKWTRHAYEIGRRTQNGNSGLVVDRGKIYCIREYQKVFVFDMASLLGREIKQQADDAETYCGAWILSCEDGGILKIQRGRNPNMFAFFKLNEAETGWERLINDALSDRSWFLSIKNNNHFSVKGTGGLQILYHLTLRSQKPYLSRCTIYSRDLINGDITNYYPGKELYWVDLGKIDQVPASCVGYVPPSNTSLFS